MAIRTLGYPSRTAAIVALRAEGFTDEDIGVKLDLEPYRVRTFAKASGKYRPGVTQEGRIMIPRRMVADLEGEAARRGLMLRQLVVKLIETIVEDRLVDAIMDDAAPSEAGGA